MNGSGYSRPRGSSLTIFETLGTKLLAACPQPIRATSSRRVSFYFQGVPHFQAPLVARPNRWGRLARAVQNAAALRRYIRAPVVRSVHLHLNPASTSFLVVPFLFFFSFLRYLFSCLFPCLLLIFPSFISLSCILFVSSLPRPRLARCAGSTFLSAASRSLVGHSIPRPSPAQPSSSLARHHAHPPEKVPFVHLTIQFARHTPTHTLHPPEPIGRQDLAPRH